MRSVPLPSARSGLCSSPGSLSVHVRSLARNAASMGCAKLVYYAHKEARAFIAHTHVGSPRLAGFGETDRSLCVKESRSVAGALVTSQPQP